MRLEEAPTSVAAGALPAVPDHLHSFPGVVLLLLLLRCLNIRLLIGHQSHLPSVVHPTCMPTISHYSGRLSLSMSAHLA